MQYVSHTHILSLYSSGSLLWKDDHQRWHKRNCRLKSQQRTLSVYETADDEKVILLISLAGATYVSSPPDCDKDLCFGISVPTTEISSKKLIVIIYCMSFYLSLLL